MTATQLEYYSAIQTQDHSKVNYSNSPLLLESIAVPCKSIIEEKDYKQNLKNPTPLDSP